MDLETSIIERLQELRKWQIEQQEKLLKQQHEQREQLTIEQEKMYEALGLKEIIDDSMLEQLSTSSRGNVLNSPRKQLNDTSTSESSRCSSPGSDQRPTRNSSVLQDFDDRPVMQLNVPPMRLTSSGSTLTNFSSPRRSNSVNYESECDSEVDKNGENRFRMSFEVSEAGVEPLPVQNKALRRSLAIDDVPVPSPKKDFKTLLEERLKESEASQGTGNNEQKTVIKRPFLKKGEGLARFKPNNNPRPSRPRSASLSAMGYTNNSKNTPKTKDTPKTSRTHNSRRSEPAIPPVTQQKLNLKTVPPPKKKFRSKSMSAALPSPPKTPKPVESRAVKSGDESNQSDLDTSKLETKMFEMLEEKAENSSFCSTSSAVIAFMQQSTPLKLRSIKKKLSAQTVSPSKSNGLQGSPVRAIRETVVQKDFVFSQWDSGPFNEDKNVSTERDIKKMITSNFQGSQQTNTKILMYNNNNIEKEDKQELEHDVFDLSCSTEMDSTLQDEKQENNYEDKEANVSMHVRFAEYNEYKTIGLTDTSMLSTDSHQDNYREEKAWSENSASSESSDVENVPRAITQNISTNIPKTNQQLSFDDYSRSNVKYPTRPKLPASMQPRNLQNYEDSTDHSTDDEHSVLNDSEGTYYDEDNTISELQEAVRRTMESYNEKMKEISHLEDITPTNERPPPVSQVKSHDDSTIFKSDLLKTRLLELEREIEIFRKENMTLSSKREKLEEEHRRRMRDMKEKEDTLEKDRIRLENNLQEEKKRLAREKAALENRLRDAREKSIQTKQERQEVQILKDQLDELRDEMNEKEQRWQAAQARQKSQMRVLQMENAKLKQEVEKLQAAKKGTAKMKRPGTLSNTKAIHQINKQLDNKRGSLKKVASISDDEDEILPRSNSDKLPPTINNDFTSPSDTGKVIVYEPSQKILPTEEDIFKKRNLYQDLLKEATGVFKEDIFRKNMENNENMGDNNKIQQKENTKDVYSMEKMLSEPLGTPPSNFQMNEGTQRSMTRMNSCPSVLKSTENIDQQSRGSYQQFVREVINPRIDPKYSHQGNQQDIKSPENQPKVGERFASEYGKDSVDNSGSLTSRVDQPKFVYSNESELTPRQNHQEPIPRPSAAVTPRAEQVSVSHLSDVSTLKLQTPSKQQVREVQHPDGYTEYWYPNGNVKKVYPDRSITKMIYYNGDVRETTEDGCIKYFYAATKTWHTTYPDGFEILEFPDGQEERRTTDGVVEVSFPDGSIRLMQPDGVEKWVLPDGTIAETFPNGEKILSLPNGQREIHTKDHKRREYPDGTVKYVYPDGTQETRYSNGRIRVKDKDGNLLRDSHQA